MRYISVLFEKSYLFIFSIVFLFVFSPPSTANELRGQEIFLAECVGCHEAKAPEEGKDIETILQKRAPSLLHAGSKFKAAFLLNWLQEPRPIRPLAYNSLVEKNPATHMILNSLDAEHMVSYLMTLINPDMESPDLEPKENLRGRQLFSQLYSCYACHQVRGETKSEIVGGLSGPSLVEAGTRLSPGWIYAMLSSPRSFNPIGSMPVYAGIISDEDMKELVKYIASFK